MERAVGAMRIATAALAVGVMLLLAFKMPLLATFRGALIALAAFEMLAFGRRVLSSGTRPWLSVEIVVKLTVLAAAYIVVTGSGW